MIQEYTSSNSFNILQNGGSPITDIIVSIITLLIWFSSGLILAYWVKRDMEKSDQKGLYMFLLIIFTSFVGFIIYIVATHGERGFSEKTYDFSEIDEIIEDEEESEFYDEVEEITEEEVEFVIDSVLKELIIERNL